jgi:hypothetical protein
VRGREEEKMGGLPFGSIHTRTTYAFVLVDIVVTCKGTAKGGIVSRGE